MVVTPGDAPAVTIEGAASGPFEVNLQPARPRPGLELFTLTLRATAPARPPVLSLVWQLPLHDIHSLWYPGMDRRHPLPPDSDAGFEASAANHAPVLCAYNAAGYNRLTFAFSDVLNPVRLRAGVNEEKAFLICRIVLFEESTAPLQFYQATLRLDSLPRPYYESLAGVGRWWAAQPGYEPAPVPPAARLPMYSTWYSFHQGLQSSQLEEEARLARESGCQSLIVDDGWQTDDHSRGYAFCGDWEVCPAKIPDMARHVERVQAGGLHYLLWYSVPFVGIESRARTRFEGRYLVFIERLRAWVLDPRFAEVREFVIELYEQAVRQWKLDGLKLDFVDRFQHYPESELSPFEGRDYGSVAQAVDRLLSDVIERLRRLKPDIMIEFRQPYTGPLMRKYGNMFRAGDCPADALSNRVRTLDIRLLCGDTAAHADMLMWHPAEPVEKAALQFVNVLFAVPQVSVRLAGLAEDHRQMVKFWLTFWRDNRDVLLDGDLAPLQPELLYPQVIATTPAKKLIAVYAPVVVRPGPGLPPQLIVVNGSAETRLGLELVEGAGVRRLEIRDCTGQVVEQKIVELMAGWHNLNVPVAGLACLTMTARKEASA